MMNWIRNVGLTPITATKAQANINMAAPTKAIMNDVPRIPDVLNKIDYILSIHAQVNIDSTLNWTT